MFNTLRQDLQAVFERDPASRTPLEVFFCYPGFHALWFYRLSHWWWERHLYFIGRFISNIGRWLTGIEIHPGARIGSGLFIDHGMGVVIGETTEIGDYVTLYHGVTLGGVSWRKEKRHPTVGDHVVIGAGAKILGPITLGDHTRVGANSVVVKDIPSNSVVVGVPGRITSRDGEKVADTAHEDLQHDVLKDVTMEQVSQLNVRLNQLERDVKQLQGSYDIEEQILASGYQGPWGI